MDKVNFRTAGPLSGAYYKAAATATAALAVVYLGLRQALPPGDAAARAALLAVPLLALLSFGAKLGLLGKGRSKGSTAALILPAAVATVGALFGAAHATDQGLYLFAGFMLGVGYGVYGLTRDIDDGVTPSRLLLVTLAQVAVLFILLG